MWVAFERLGMLVFLLLVLWQVALPIILNRPTFPLVRHLFRRSKKVATAEEKLDAAQEDYVVYDIEREANELRARMVLQDHVEWMKEERRRGDQKDATAEGRVGEVGDDTTREETDKRPSETADAGQPATKNGDSNV